MEGSDYVESYVVKAELYFVLYFTLRKKSDIFKLVMNYKLFSTLLILSVYIMNKKLNIKSKKMYMPTKLLCVCLCKCVHMTVIIKRRVGFLPLLWVSNVYDKPNSPCGDPGLRHWYYVF